MSNATEIIRTFINDNIAVSDEKLQDIAQNLNDGNLTCFPTCESDECWGVPVVEDNDWVWNCHTCALDHITNLIGEEGITDIGWADTYKIVKTIIDPQVAALPALKITATVTEKN